MWSQEQLEYVRSSAQDWDRYYSESFWGTGLFEVARPLLMSFNPDHGVPKQIAVPSESLPETTATVLLALHRMGLLRADMRESIQAYLWSTHYAVAAGLGNEGAYPEAQCWSSATRNVWTSAACLWALLATGYRGPHEERYEPAARWLANQQNDDGSWSFSHDDANPSSVFLTAVATYSLHLAETELRQQRPHGWGNDIRLTITTGLDYLRRSQRQRTGLWHLPSGEPEPTGSAMALWALRRCGGSGVGSLVASGLRGLSKHIKSGHCGASCEIAAGTLPDSREPIALQGYTPAIALALLQLGLDPSHRLITDPLRFLRLTRQPLGWDFPMLGQGQPGRYLKSVPYVGTGEPLTFTTALALQTVHAWHRRLVRATITSSLSR